MIIPAELLVFIQTYLPELIGAFAVSQAFNFFGTDKISGQNDMHYASMGFLMLSIKDILFMIPTLLPLLFNQETRPVLMEGISLFFIAVSSVLMIAGGLRFYKRFRFITKDIAYTLSISSILFLWLLMFFSSSTWQDTLPHVFLGTGLLCLGFFVFLTSSRNEALNARGIALALWGLALFYLMTTAVDVSTYWWVQAGLYTSVVFATVLATNSFLKTQMTALGKELELCKAKIPLIIQSSPFPIMISQLRDDRLMLVNEKAGELFNIDIHNPKQFRTEDYYVDPNARRELLKKLSISPIVESYQVLLRRPGSDKPFWLDMSARVIDFDNEIALYTAFKDITAQKQYEQDLFEKAVKDPLTGCYNRRQFNELIAREMSRYLRYNTVFSLIMMDIDHFKRVNDTYGHDVGDLVLKQMASCAASAIRASDILCRFGGEEFMIILPETTIENAYVAAEKIRKKIEQLQVPLTDGRIVRFTLSLGISESTQTSDVETLIKYADNALYTAKETGRNRSIMYSLNQNFEEIKQDILVPDKLSEDIIKTAQKAGSVGEIKGSK